MHNNWTKGVVYYNDSCPAKTYVVDYRIQCSGTVSMLRKNLRSMLQEKKLPIQTPANGMMKMMFPAATRRSTIFLNEPVQR